MAVLRGLEELESKLRELDRATQGDALMSALLENVEPTRARAAELAPVGSAEDRDPHPGRLKAHEDIAKVPALSTSKVAVVHVGPRRDAFYGVFEEIGTAHITAEPYLLPAFNETEKEVLDRTAESFRKAVLSV